MFSRSVLHMQVHHLGRRHQVVVDVRYDPDRATDDEKYYDHAEGEGENIVRAFRAAAEMQEKDEVNADLSDGEHEQADRDARSPQQIGLRHDKGSDRRYDR